MEITIERIVIWLALGFYICYKRNWYEPKSGDEPPSSVSCTFAIIIAPVNFLIVFFKIFFIDKWNNQ